MNALQLAIAAGSVVGLGLTLVVARLVPAQPDLRTTMRRLAPPPSSPSRDSDRALDFTERLGVRFQGVAPAAMTARVPRRDLAVLRRPTSRYFGEKVVFAGLGLVFPAVASLMLLVVGVRVPFVLPAVGSLVLGIALSFIPDHNVRDDAARARREFRRALGAYIDLVALERHAGSGSTQSLEVAAGVGDSWVFQRIREELDRARWAGHTPWDGLSRLADELGLPELSDLADIMRLSGEEGASVYATLRARATSLRSALVAEELGRANAAEERMTFPVTALAFIFLLLVSTPAVLRIVFGGAT